VKESTRGNPKSTHYSKLAADGMLNLAQAEKIAKQTTRYKRYFKCMDRSVVMQHNLVDRLLDSIDEAFHFKPASQFNKQNETALQTMMKQAAENLAMHNRRQSLVPRITNYIIHAIRAERDRILKAVKTQIKGDWWFFVWVLSVKDQLTPLFFDTLFILHFVLHHRALGHGWWRSD
jgi:hypothetical protein